MKRTSNEMVVRETSSPVINMLVQVLCDRRSNWDLKSQAAELICLQARYNAVMEREKRAGTLTFSDDPDSDVAHTISVSLYHAWEATKDGPDLERLRDLIADCIVRMRRMLEELGRQ